MAKVTIRCASCHKPSLKEAGAVNRAAEIGAPLYCNRTCAGIARRKGKTKAEKVSEKRVYDAAYRVKHRAYLKALKAAYFQRTYDPVKAAKVRKKRMPHHVEYCRQPRYKNYKREYDLKRRASEYGPFAEAYTLAMQLNREVKQRASNYEIRRQNETGNKRQARRRAEAPDRNRSSQT